MSTQNKYEIVYADPPWSYYNDMTVAPDVTTVKGVRRPPYPVMSSSDIMQLDVKSICSENAILLIWTTDYHLQKCLKVIEAWGFKYSTCLTWAKKPMGGGLGGTFRIGHEHLIYATRGKAGAKGKIKGTVFDVKREYEGGYPCHSRKPKFFLDMIDGLSHGPKLELFARREREGWDVYGNQVKNSIEI